MFSLRATFFDSDHAGDAIAAEAGLVYRPLSDLRGLLVRSYCAHFFGWGLASFAVCLAVLHGVGQANGLRESLSLAGAGGYLTAFSLGLAGVGAGMRTAWGRVLCLGISALMLLEVSWYVSSPSHWYWNMTSAVMLGRFLVGWIGLVSFVGTHELFGSDRVGHAVLKEAVEMAQESKVQENALLKMHAEGLREASRPVKPTRAA